MYPKTYTNVPPIVYNYFVLMCRTIDLKNAFTETADFSVVVQNERCDRLMKKALDDYDLSLRSAQNSSRSSVRGDEVPSTRREGRSVPPTSYDSRRETSNPEARARLVEDLYVGLATEVIAHEQNFRSALSTFLPTPKLFELKTIVDRIRSARMNATAVPASSSGLSLKERMRISTAPTVPSMSAFTRR